MGVNGHGQLFFPRAAVAYFSLHSDFSSSPFGPYNSVTKTESRAAYASYQLTHLLLLLVWVPSVYCCLLSSTCSSVISRCFLFVRRWGSLFFRYISFIRLNLCIDYFLVVDSEPWYRTGYACFSFVFLSLHRLASRWLRALGIGDFNCSAYRSGSIGILVGYYGRNRGDRGGDDVNMIDITIWSVTAYFPVNWERNHHGCRSSGFR
ncbi:hypothetical protein BJ508DRAFT_145524 [Ascobolus immersus RN42]|uniref:Uncharacterized protein n=1 Tax=Ascobolus immersus RN42 TaxID=1160509 RepID=A0A3N4I330_ASCIM|nr:hypothetical protein BJ508DRAFT_145524 [Ascobolus immersus RN42]